jgi:hypothetical protein
MKTLTYTGFGFKNEVEVNFKISIFKTVDKNKVLVEILSNDLRVDWAKEEYDEKDHWEEKVKLAEYSQYFIHAFDQYEGFNDSYWTKTTEIPRNWKSQEVYVENRFQYIEEAILFIKNTVTFYRGYWKAQKGDHNKLVVRLRELEVEDFLDENFSGEITITESKTVKIK